MDFSMISLEGKVALVTGGSRGIGRTSALALADAGADVVVASRKLADLEKVAGEIKARGRKGLAIASHVAKGEEVKSLVEKVLAEFGRIDILVNNAGTNPYFGPLMDAEEWAWDVTMNVNLKGPFLLSQLAARAMKNQGGGNIINVSSVGGLKATELHIYGVSKAALIMLTQLMAKEWGQHNIRVNAIAPGVIRTQMVEAMWKVLAEDEKATIQRNAIPRIGEPEDVARLILFLASDLSSYITGETIVIDGGELLGGPSFPGQ
ncbi:SDR family NAD(P)-dependent oxidoreductase [Chloroflexota bacterium]